MAKLRAILIMSLMTLIIYAANRLILSLPQFEAEYSTYHYNIAMIYCFFWVCAAVIIFAANIIHDKSPDNTGYVFIGTTLVQMGLCYIMLKPILALGEKANFEKINFFIIFILFLTIETVLTIRLLNNKQ